jgi:RNA-directed DNA polymerase
MTTPLPARSAETPGLHRSSPLEKAGWMTYYGRFYRTELHGLLKRINTYLVRWARRKFRRPRAFKRAKRWWHGLLQRQPALFAHWAWMTEF